MAYHDIAKLSQAGGKGETSQESSANLYKAWLLTQNNSAVSVGGSDSSQESSAVWKSKFIDFIEDYCEQRLTAL